MAASTNNATGEYAMSLIERLSLDNNDILQLIEIMEEDRSAALPFDELTDVLSTLSAPIPAYLTSNEAALDVYTEQQMDEIVELLELRHWHDNVRRLFENFWCWRVIFSTPRHRHREALDWFSVEDRVINVSMLMSVLDPSTPWLRLLYRPPHECVDPWYGTLRREYFPGGIDDALPGFLRHVLELQEAVAEVERRRPGFQEEELPGLGTVCDENIKLAAEWFRETANRLGFPKSPEQKFGLYYRHSFSPSTHPIPNQPHPYLPGSAWCDWFRNVVEDTDPMYCYTFPASMLPLVTDDRIKGYEAPMEIAIPYAAIGIARYFTDILSSAQEMLFEAGEIPSLEPWTPEERERNSRAVSEATGEPYWRVRRLYRHGCQCQMLPHWTVPELQYRPIYDMAGNLRFDFMNAVLHEVTFKEIPSDYLTHMISAVLSSMPPKDSL
ncbi:hypothetical protein SAMD00023353_8100090 [Rosellinia necatrix]|uniref:Uncharacterized protein n=1 Tax=Rosellinia necatrix TaxID=77044 RepID=A0A1W2TV37_ROSNE|nr:hypothetical protein SAMD00023353_8100090 [Rosellinia necatrix]